MDTIMRVFGSVEILLPDELKKLLNEKEAFKIVYGDVEVDPIIHYFALQKLLKEDIEVYDDREAVLMELLKTTSAKEDELRESIDKAFGFILFRDLPKVMTNLSVFNNVVSIFGGYDLQTDAITQVDPEIIDFTVRFIEDYFGLSTGTFFKYCIDDIKIFCTSCFFSQGMLPKTPRYRYLYHIYPKMPNFSTVKFNIDRQLLETLIKFKDTGEKLPEHLMKKINNAMLRELHLNKYYKARIDLIGENLDMIGVPRGERS